MKIRLLVGTTRENLRVKVRKITPKAFAMAKPNYQYEKRQRELQKKQKKEEKAQRKAHTEPAAQEQPAPPPQNEPVAE